MKLIETMFVWTPNRHPFDKIGAAGTVEVTTIPEAETLRVHPMSAGACDLDWREEDDHGRRTLLEKYLGQMRNRDNISEPSIQAALNKLDG